MNVRPKLLVKSLSSTAQLTASNKTKPPTHYETLEINSRATQGEIKSAYFKLSMQYHPDKNSSEAATSKFRDVSEAYEVLGNYNSRRSYDRSILTHTSYHTPQKSGKTEDPKMKYYQSQAALYRQGTTGSTPAYDFDAWTKAHYGMTLDRHLRDKVNAARKRQERKGFHVPEANNKDVGALVFAIVFLIAVMVLGIQQPIENEPALTIRQRFEIDSKNQSETEMGESRVVTLSSK